MKKVIFVISVALVGCTQGPGTYRVTMGDGSTQEFQCESNFSTIDCSTLQKCSDGKDHRFCTHKKIEKIK